MPEYHLAEAEKKFAQLIWKHEPLTSRRLVELAAQELGWKKSTTYTVLKRLSERGLFVNDGGTVRALISRSDYYAERSERFVDERSFAASRAGALCRRPLAARCPAFSRRLWVGASSRRPRRRSCGT